MRLAGGRAVRPIPARPAHHHPPPTTHHPHMLDLLALFAPALPLQLIVRLPGFTSDHTHPHHTKTGGANPDVLKVQTRRAWFELLCLPLPPPLLLLSASSPSPLASSSALLCTALSGLLRCTPVARSPPPQSSSIHPSLYRPHPPISGPQALRPRGPPSPTSTCLVTDCSAPPTTPDSHHHPPDSRDRPGALHPIHSYTHLAPSQSHQRTCFTLDQYQPRVWTTPPSESQGRDIYFSICLPARHQQPSTPTLLAWMMIVKPLASP